MTEHNPLESSGSPLSPDLISSLEQQLGAPLPGDYKHFLLESNGGTPKKSYFAYVRGSTLVDFWVDDFFIINGRLNQPDVDAPTSSLSFWNYHFGRIMPPEAMMIGCVCRDHKLLLFLRGPRCGQVHLVDWDIVDRIADIPTRSDIERAMQFVASSFGEFFENLYEQPRHRRD